MAAMNPDEIISILKEEIKNYDEISKDQEVGTVISVGDGIATVYGIDHAMSVPTAWDVFFSERIQESRKAPRLPELASRQVFR